MHSTYTQVGYTCTSCSVLLCSCCVVICTQIKGMCVCMPLHMVVAAMGMWGWCMCLYNNPTPLWCVALQCICWAYSMRAEDGEVSPWLWTLFGRDTTVGPVTSGGAEVIEGCQVGSDKLANIPIARARHHTHSMWLAVADGVCRSLQSLDLRDITPSKCLSGCQYGSHVHEQVTHIICGLCAHVLAICTCTPPICVRNRVEVHVCPCRHQPYVPGHGQGAWAWWVQCGSLHVTRACGCASKRVHTCACGCSDSVSGSWP